MGELISPMQPHAAQNEVASSPSDSESVGSSVFESDDHSLDDKQPLKTNSSPVCNSIHLPIIHEITC